MMFCVLNSQISDKVFMCAIIIKENICSSWGEMENGSWEGECFFQAVMKISPIDIRNNLYNHAIISTTVPYNRLKGQNLRLKQEET